jgi:hypothetical protein
MDSDITFEKIDDLNLTENNNIYFGEKNFPKMPILYLEYIENKYKLHSKYIGTFYKPKIIKKEEKIKDNIYKWENVCEETKTREKKENEMEENINIYDAIDISKETNYDIQEKNKNVVPPSLEEINKETPLNFKSMFVESNEKELNDKRNDIVFKFQILKKLYPEASIPEFTPYFDPYIMKDKYDILKKELELNNSVENWKKNFITFVMICEVVIGYVFKIEMEGFAQQQIELISSYEEVFIELSKKKFFFHSSIPIELKFFLIFGGNIIFFLISKKILNSSGVDLTNTFKNFFKQTKIKTPEEIYKSTKQE